MSVIQKVQMYDLSKIGKSLNPNNGGYFCCVAKKWSEVGRERDHASKSSWLKLLKLTSSYASHTNRVSENTLISSNQRSSVYTYCYGYLIRSC